MGLQPREIRPQPLTLLIHGATVYTPERTLPHGALLVENGRITAVDTAAALAAAPATTRRDAGGLLLAPGFIDLQINGGFGHDFTARPQTIWSVAERLPQFGVTAFLPTIISAPAATVRRAREALGGPAPAAFRGARPLGLHLEGPFLNPHKKGAHDARYLRLPDVATAAAWSPASGVRLVTLAPELRGAPEVIAALRRQGVVVAAGHSQATYAEAQTAVAAGVGYATHLFNAMSTFHHRAPGLAGALLEAEQVTLGLIADGVHLHPALLRLAWRLAGHGRINLVTDAMAALGMSPGAYRLGTAEVHVEEEAARLADGTLAGSVLSLDAAVRRWLAATGCSRNEALATVTAVPARLLGLEGQKGRIAPGYDADLVLLTPDLRVAAVYVAGELVYEADAS